jgi:L-cysteine S-thiosulfotransferase
VALTVGGVRLSLCSTGGKCMSGHLPKIQRSQLKRFILTVCWLLSACATATDGMVRYQVEGDSISEPLTLTPGDAVRGRLVMVSRDGNCLLCHSIPETGERFMGNVAPPLSRVASRLTEGQLRLRVVDPTRVNRDVAMPAYYRIVEPDGVAEPYRGKPILTAQQVEDVVAYLLTLR